MSLIDKNDDDYQSLGGKQSRGRKLLLASAAVMALCGGMYGYSNWASETPEIPANGESFNAEESFVADDGTEWFPMDDSQLMEQFNVDPEMLEHGLELPDTKTIPGRFWTAANGRGAKYGSGVGNGFDFVVFKSLRTNLYLTEGKNGHARHDGKTSEANSKFKPHFFGNGVIGLKNGFSNKMLYCQPDIKKVEVRFTKPGGWEQFRVYQNRDAKGSVALKAVVAGTWVTADQGNWVNCKSTKPPGAWEKWGGWH